MPSLRKTSRAVSGRSQRRDRQVASLSPPEGTSRGRLPVRRPAKRAGQTTRELRATTRAGVSGRRSAGQQRRTPARFVATAALHHAGRNKARRATIRRLLPLLVRQKRANADAAGRPAPARLQLLRCAQGLQEAVAMCCSKNVDTHCIGLVTAAAARVRKRARKDALQHDFCYNVARSEIKFDIPLRGRQNFRFRVVEGYPSGQRDQTVNLTALPSKVRILLPPPRISLQVVRAGVNWFCGCSSMVELKPSKLKTRVRFPSPAPRCGLAVVSIVSRMPM